MTSRRAAFALAVVAVAAAGCGSSSSGAGGSPPTPPPTHSPTQTPTAPVTVTASASATKTVTPSATSTPHPTGPCATSQLTLSLGQSQGAAGNFYTPLIVTNSGATCTLFGYPGVSYINSAGAQVGKPAARQGGPVATVTVKHGATASALLHQPNPLAFPASACHKAKTAGIRFYPPGQKASLTVSSKNQVCTTKQGESSITTMQPGSNPQL